MAVETNVRVGAPGGPELATDIYRDADQPAAPTVVIRTPYGKANLLEEGLFWAGNGYNCVIQDVRGCFESEGVWAPYTYERDDALATANWLAAQDWNDGRVVASGSSYAAFTAWMMALAAPGMVGAVISRVPAMGLAAVKFEVDGVLRLAEHVAWWLTWGDCRTTRPRLARRMIDANPDLLAHLPVIDIGRRLWAAVPGWSSVFTTASRTSAEVLDEEELASLDVASLHIGGWHDVLLPATLRMWTSIGAANVSRPSRALLIGPWPHELTAAGTTFGERDFGASSRIRLGSYELEWIRRVLSGERDPAPVRIFAMGRNEWLDLDDWPHRSASETTMYAAPANRLLPGPPETTGSDTYDYDPDDPYPSRIPPVDRSDLDQRSDVARYTSSPLAQPLDIIGTPMVTLNVLTDCPSTDFIVRLVEERPDGTVLQISRGCLVVDQESPVPQIHTVTLTPTALTVEAGHRLRLEFTSSDFPELARNLNTGQDRHLGSHCRIARQTIFHGGPTPTLIVLPNGAPT